MVVAVLLSLAATAGSANPARGDDDDRRGGRWRNWYNNNWYGARNTPYYWRNWNNRPYTPYPTYSPYRAYSPYDTWGGYYGGYRYYNSARNYPWGWYY
jgi:hypothetical protein